jgi:hypothetical protein
MTLTEVPAWIVTATGPERVRLPIPAAEFLADREAVTVGVSLHDWTPTPAQVAYATGRREALYPPTELPLSEWITARRERGY